MPFLHLTPNCTSSYVLFLLPLLLILEFFFGGCPILFVEGFLCSSYYVEFTSGFFVPWFSLFRLLCQAFLLSRWKRELRFLDMF